MGSLSETSSYGIKEANTEIVKEEEADELFSMEMAAATIRVEDYEEAGLVIISPEDMVEAVAEKMTVTAGEKNGGKWPGAWEFERDEHYFQWIWYCPDVVFVLDSHHQLPNYKSL